MCNHFWQSLPMKSYVMGIVWTFVWRCPLETTCICIAIMDINRETTVQCFYEKQGVAISQINKKNKENSENTPHSLHTNNIHCTSSPTSVPSSAIVVCLAAIAAMIFRFPSPI